MPIPFLNSITLNKNEIQEFKVYNLTPDPTLTSAGDYGYMWLNTSDSPKTLKWWDGTSIRSIVDSGNTSTLTVGTANDLSGGVAGSLPYQQGVGDTTFLGIGSSGYILTSTGSAPQWSASIPSTSVSGLAASATTDTTNASNISSGTLGLARLSLASGQFYVGDGSNNPAATAKSSIPLSGFGAAGADVAMGGFKITGLADPAAATDAATRGYVDSVAQGLDVKASCLVATTTDITLASPGAVTIDGIYSATDFTAGTTRILVKDQSAPAENGIYIWQGPSSAMTRSADANTWDELVGAFTFIERGTANADSGWVCTSNAGGTLGSTAVTFVKFSQAGSYTAGNGIVQSGTSFNFAQSAAYTAGQIPFASSTTAMGFNANLHWDNANNRLGIGTATPGARLDINAGTNLNLAVGGLTLDNFTNDGVGITFSRTISDDDLMALGVCDTDKLGLFSREGLIFATGGPAFYSQTTERLRIASDGVCTWSNVVNAGTAMTLNGTGLGVGVNPDTNLHVRKDFAGYTTIKVQNNSSLAAGTGAGFTLNDGGVDASWFRRQRDGSGNTDIGYKDTLRFRGAITATERTDMLIDTSGNVGIGTTTPSYTLDVNGTARIGTVATAGRSALLFSSGASNFTIEQTNNGSGSHVFLFKLPGWTNDAFVWNRGSTQLATLNGDGNLGLGVTPSAWVASGYKAAEFGALGNALLGGTNDFYLSCNTYYSSGWKFASANAACYLELTGGAFQFFQSTASPVVNQSISASPRMVLDASGNLGLGTASPSSYGKFAVVSGATASLAYFDTTVATAYSPTSYFTGANITIRTAANATGNACGIRFSSNENGSLDGLLGWVQNASGSGDLVVQGRNGAYYAERLRIKSTGQLNFTGLSSDPAGAAGDVYYNSGSNVFKVYDTGWKTLPRKYVVQLSDGSVTVAGNAYTLTHNFASKDVTISIRRTTDDAVVLADVTMPTTNTATVTFAAAITAANYYVTVIG